MIPCNIRRFISKDGKRYMDVTTDWWEFSKPEKLKEFIESCQKHIDEDHS